MELGGCPQLGKGQGITIPKVLRRDVHGVSPLGQLHDLCHILLVHTKLHMPVIEQMPCSVANVTDHGGLEEIRDEYPQGIGQLRNRAP